MPGASAGLVGCFFSFRIALCQWLILGLEIKGVIPPPPKLSETGGQIPPRSTPQQSPAGTELNPALAN